MRQNSVKTALLSVFDKRNIVTLAQKLVAQGYCLLSSGGTYRTIAKHVAPERIQQISAYTGYAELLQGRVKTLHPRIHAGILCKRDDKLHQRDMFEHDIRTIDLVVVNLYPFEKVLKAKEPEETLLEHIDIGGHTLIRAAAKNYRDVLIITDPNDYDAIVPLGNDVQFRKRMAAKAMHHCTVYDMSIAGYFNGSQKRYQAYDKVMDLKYGLNPQQEQAMLMKRHDQPSCPFDILNGSPGFINILDATYAWALVDALKKETSRTAVASYKHTSPAGVAVDTQCALNDLEQNVFMLTDHNTLSHTARTYARARNVDPMSSFGDFVAISGCVDVSTARLIKREVSDGIVALDYDPDALALLKKKRGGNYVILKAQAMQHDDNNSEVRSMHGITLVQDANRSRGDAGRSDVSLDLHVANVTLKYTQSNSVCACYQGTVIGIGAGQQSRIDCVKLVKQKIQRWYLRYHPKVLQLQQYFKPGLKRAQKINAIIHYIDGFEQSTKADIEHWRSHFKTVPTPLSHGEKQTWFSKPINISLASDAFFPFRDSIDVAAQCGVCAIIQPGGSVQDDEVLKACKEYGIEMIMTGRAHRMFLH